MHDCHKAVFVPYQNKAYMLTSKVSMYIFMLGNERYLAYQEENLTFVSISMKPIYTIPMGPMKILMINVNGNL